MPLVSVIVIGLNEENLLPKSLQSVFDSVIIDFNIEVIYVDSNSVDNSLNIADSFEKVNAYVLDCDNPSAAKARNFGLKKAKGEFVQFLDGDSILNCHWLQTAYSEICKNEDLACVFGSLVERCPETSIYNKVCAYDWHIAQGEYRLCGGNAFWRKSVLDEVGYFDEVLSAGEEPDLCYRVRQTGRRIFCLGATMAQHDLEMNSFKQYWHRGIVNGRAYATIALRYRHTEEKLWFKEMIKNFIEPVAWIVLFTVAFYLISFGYAVLFVFLFWILRAVKIALSNMTRIPNFVDGVLYGLHLQLIRVPTFSGQLKACLIYFNL